MDISQSLRLEQRMKLSPRLIQSMEILQLPMMALQERIDQELASNPCLELPETTPEDESEELQDEPVETVGNEGVEATVRSDEGFERLVDFDERFAEDLDWSDRPYRPAVAEELSDAKAKALANTAAPGESLNDYLLQQWSFIDAPEEIKTAGEIIINNIDDDGYLRVPLEQLADGERIGNVSAEGLGIESFKEALKLVQKLDPPGVGARDLRECLLIQLDAEAAAGRDVSLQRLLVDEYLREIELNHIPQIAKRTGRNVQEVKRAIERLGRLTPRPGRLIGSQPVPPIVPDAVVELDQDGNVVVKMRDDGTSTVRISETYRRMARSGKTDPKTKEFLRNNLRAARWLISAIRQRRETIRRVIEAVFQEQKEFIERGTEALKPLPMTKVASAVGVHVASVSRAVAGKYVQTPRGIFPLRMFFSGGKTTADGKDIAWNAIRVRLQEIIEHEDKKKPLSDDEIAQALQREGISIARRTVAKYRRLLNIPPARQRKQY